MSDDSDLIRVAMHSFNPWDDAPRILTETSYESGCRFQHHSGHPDLPGETDDRAYLVYDDGQDGLGNRWVSWRRP